MKVASNAAVDVVRLLSRHKLVSRRWLHAYQDGSRVYAVLELNTGGILWVDRVLDPPSFDLIHVASVEEAVARAPDHVRRSWAS